MSSVAVLTVYCLLIVVASLLGGRLPAWIRLTHQRMQLLISFVGGLMLGIAVFHMLPHAIVHLGIGEIDRVSLCLMLGLLVMFFLLRTFHFHHHDPGSIEPESSHAESDHVHSDSCSGHPVSAGHQHSIPGMASEMSWLGVFIGLSLHTLIDGLILGASIEGDVLHAQSALLPGLGIFLAILLHKPLDALSITTLMQAAHWPARWQMIVNAAFAAMCPVGAALFLVGASYLVEQQTLIVGCTLAFAAGVFLCISLSDLLPEMEMHSHHRLSLSMALLAGIALAWSLKWIEPVTAHRPALRRTSEWNTVERSSWEPSLDGLFPGSRSPRSRDFDQPN